MNRLYYYLLSCAFLFLCTISDSFGQTDPNHPNILLIIADDLGVDALKGYQDNPIQPNTPVLDNLRANGLTFDNAWSAPACTPTRAAIMSGKFGIKNGVRGVPGNLDTIHTSIFKELENQTGGIYADAVIGKWHISQPIDFTHPAQHNVDHYEGFFSSSVPNYFSWPKVKDEMESPETEYVTTNFTNAAASWINDQNQPWFLWLAHVAPHTPFHVPPDSMYTSTRTNNNQRKFITMIESIDFEIGRLMDSIPPTVLNNTVIIFIGDNGTPTGVIQKFPSDHAKNTLYQGGVHVPMIVSGKGVTRTNDREGAMVHVTDLYATILEIAGATLPGGMYNSLSFEHLLSGTSGAKRPYNYTELVSGSVTGWAIRNEQYKLIEFHDGTQEFYDLIADTIEVNNLINNLSATQILIKEELEAEADVIRNNWSCQDLIQNGTETDIDVCIPLVCSGDNSTSQTNIGCCVTPSITSAYSETISGDTRIINTNNFPDHDYCHTAQNVPDQRLYTFNMDATPSVSGSITSVLTNTNRPDNYYGVALNGVLLAPAPATPFIFENTETGEYNWDWVFEPTNNQGSGASRVGLDCASAHTGPQGYHYHGNMFEYAENIQTGLSTTMTAPLLPVQIGWASDGFPILYRFGPDENGNLVLLEPSYQLKSGERPGDGISAPCGAYNGKYTNDYEYINNLGDLDECNGVERSITLTTAQGSETFNYFYVITDSFPQIGRCVVGVQDTTFDNSNKGTVLPLDLISFQASYDKANSQTNLNWTTANEINVSHFSIERSTNGYDFVSIGSVSATKSTSLQYYTYQDIGTISGLYYYRLKIIDLDYSYEYSTIETVQAQNIFENALNIYPNPSVDNFRLSLQVQKGISYTFKLYNQSGVVVHHQTLKETQAISKNLILGDDLPVGIYYLELSSEQILLETKKLVKLNL